MARNWAWDSLRASEMRTKHGSSGTVRATAVLMETPSDGIPRGTALAAYADALLAGEKVQTYTAHDGTTRFVTRLPAHLRNARKATPKATERIVSGTGATVKVRPAAPAQTRKREWWVAPASHAAPVYYNNWQLEK